MNDDIDVVDYIRRHWVSTSLGILLVISSLMTKDTALAIVYLALAASIVTMSPFVMASWRAGIKWPAFLFAAILFFIPGLVRGGGKLDQFSRPSLHRDPTVHQGQ